MRVSALSAWPERTQGSFIRARHQHLLRYHDGQGIYKPPPELKLTSRGKKADFHWRCPLCKQGLLRSEVEDRVQNQVTRAKTAHRLQAHPEISAKVWKCMMVRQAMTPLRQARIRAAKSNDRTSRIKLQELPEYVVPFVLPIPPRKINNDDDGLKQPRAWAKVAFKNCWKCRRCGGIARTKTSLKQHLGKQCPDIYPAVVQARLRRLKGLKRQVAGSQATGYTKEQLHEIFESARRAIEEVPSQPSSRF